MTRPKPFQRLLLTGAAGGLGRVLRPRLREWTDVLRVSDRADCGTAVELVARALFTPRVDHTIVYGVSDNPVKWWDNAKAAHLGFRPRDSVVAQVTYQHARIFRFCKRSSQKFAHLFPPRPLVEPDSPVHRFQGGPWVRSGPIED